MKMMLRSLLFLLLLVRAAAAQQLPATLQVLGEKYVPERVYLHYDKAAYAPGETVWFKAYLMEGILPAEGSKTLYIDWVDPAGSLLAHQAAPVVAGTAQGQFTVPAAYKAGALRVRAYTKWMLNFDSALLYDKQVRILAQAPATASKPPAATTTLQFFPEGGEAVAGLPQKIAFKAADQWGRPVAVRGAIVDDKGTQVDSFRTEHDGMGFFFHTPAPGVRYTARWKDSRRAVQTTALPAARQSGIVLQLDPAGARRRFGVARPAEAPDQLKTIHLIGTMHGQLVFQTRLDLGSRTAMQGVIPTAALPTGVLTVTAFDAAWNALAERIVFVRNNDHLFQPTLEVERWGLSKRARNELLLTLPDSVPANFSVSVTDRALAADSSDHILSHLLLGSELKGRIHRPAYYFSDSTEAIARQLDLVMLTHGWRRFQWEELVVGRLPQLRYARDSAYLTLSGQVYGATAAQLREAGSLVLIINAKDSSNMVVAPIDPSGRFADPDFIFFDTLQVYYQLPKKGISAGADVRFMESRLPAPRYTSWSSALLPLADTASLTYQRLRAAEALQRQLAAEGKLLQNVTVTARTKSPLELLDEKYASGFFRSGANSVEFDLVNDRTAFGHTSIFNYLQGKVAGLQITGQGANVSLQWRGGSPSVFLNEMLTDVEMLSSIPVTDIAYIKVFRPPFMGAPGGAGASGAIAIYTRKGNDMVNTPGTGLPRSTVTGYTPSRVFYSPNYDTFDRRHEERDLRTTLYWNPQVVSNGHNRTLKITFHNNDVTEAFRVVIQGMTSDGRLTHLEQIME